MFILNGDTVNFNESLTSRLTVSRPLCPCACWLMGGGLGLSGALPGWGQHSSCHCWAAPPSPSAYPLTSTMVTSPQLKVPYTSPGAKETGYSCVSPYVSEFKIRVSVLCVFVCLPFNLPAVSSSSHVRCWLCVCLFTLWLWDRPSSARLCHTARSGQGV